MRWLEFEEKTATLTQPTNRLKGFGILGKSSHDLGWAFLLAWVFCLFYMGGLENHPGVSAIDSPDFASFLFGCFPLIALIVTLAGIIVCEKRLGAPSSHRWLFWASPTITSCATLLLVLSGSPSFATAALFVAGSVLAGFGSAFLWVLWGEYYTSLSPEESEKLAPISAILAGILALAVSAMSGWVADAVVVAFPLLSGVCLVLSWRDRRPLCGGDHLAHEDGKREAVPSSGKAQAPVNPPSLLVLTGRTGLGLFGVCLFVSLAGTFWSWPAHDALPPQIIILASIVFLIALSLAVSACPCRISMLFLFRWMCPTVVIAFTAIIVWGSPGGTYLAALIGIAARFALCLIVQLSFAEYAKSGLATPTQSSGLGWIFIHAGDLAGVAVSFIARNMLLEGTMQLAPFCAICIALVIVLVTFVLNDRRSFSFEMQDFPLEAESAQPSTRTNSEKAQQTFEKRIRELATHHGLTPRETQVFSLLARGRSIPYVRDELVISKETAATHAKHVYAKLGVHSRQELIDLAANVL